VVQFIKPMVNNSSMT